jgi:hypothetical protein
MVDFEKQKNSPYTYRKMPYLCRKGLFQPVTKRLCRNAFLTKRIS